MNLEHATSFNVLKSLFSFININNPHFRTFLYISYNIFLLIENHFILNKKYKLKNDYNFHNFKKLV